MCGKIGERVGRSGHCTGGGELDLPPEPLRLAAGSTAPALPLPSGLHAVLLQQRDGVRSTLVTMHRSPFWLIDRSGAHHAVVMYVASGGQG